MLRVLLVDDEPHALEGLKLLIDWEAEGFEICGECASAGEALRKLTPAKPDLIVTDIRMPGMSGLDLLNASRQAGFDGQFVIVSGYNDFDYAKQALQFGVAGYLLKPIDPADAAPVLAHVRRKLIDREAAANQRSKVIHHAITRLLTDWAAQAENIPPAARWYLATWGAPLPYPVVQDLLSLFGHDEATAHIVEDKEYLVLRQYGGDDAPDFREAEALLKQHHRQLTISRPVANPTDLFALRQQLSGQLDKACRPALTEHVDALARAVALRQADECVQRCAELEAFCAAYGANALTYARRQLLSICSGLLSDRGDALKTFLLSQDEDFHTLCRIAVELLAPEQKRISDRMERYAREHASEHITVSGIAADLGYNATYLGRKFCEERGIGFREWLANLRLQQGAALLRSTDQSVGSIAKAVGYGHYKRFLRHFKQCYSMTPEQYRRQKP